MRTKSLFIAAAALAAGIASSSAQGVYSQNVVGYVNLTLSEGFNLISVQLDADGTGTNDTIPAVFGNPSSLPVGSIIYVFDYGTVTFDQESWVKNKAGTSTNWVSSTGSDLHVNPGTGFWLDVPVGSYGGSTGTVTLTGNVLQGNLVNPNISGSGYFLVSSMVPLSGGVGTSLSYAPNVNDIVYIWDPSITNYDQYTYAKNKAGTATNWSSTFGNVEPSLNVGQGFWLFSSQGSGWTNNFSVQ